MSWCFPTVFQFAFFFINHILDLLFIAYCPTTILSMWYIYNLGFYILQMSNNFIIRKTNVWSSLFRILTVCKWSWNPIFIYWGHLHIFNLQTQFCCHFLSCSSLQILKSERILRILITLFLRLFYILSCSSHWSSI